MLGKIDRYLLPGRGNTLHMIAYPLLSDPGIALGSPDIFMAQHFTDVLQGNPIVQHHVCKSMTGQVGIQLPFNSADVCQLF